MLTLALGYLPRYIPIDVSGKILETRARELLKDYSVVRQGSVVRVVRVVRVGRRSKVGGIIVLVSFWEVSLTRPNFLVLKAEKFALFWRQKCAQP